MSVDNIERFITPSFVRDLFQNSTINGQEKGWAITISGKILTIGGKMFFKTREQAVKAFYDRYNWRVRSKVHEYLHPNEGHWWGVDSRTYWIPVKKVLEKDYGLKFIKL